MDSVIHLPESGILCPVCRRMLFVNIFKQSNKQEEFFAYCEACNKHALVNLKEQRLDFIE